jgi:hypothetical protein
MSEIEEHAKVLKASVMMIEMCMERGEISEEIRETIPEMMEMYIMHMMNESDKMSEEYKKDMKDIGEIISRIM